MKRFTGLALKSALMCLPHFALADDIRIIHLQNSDGGQFRKVLVGLSYPETIPDPTNPYIWRVIIKYESKNEALKMACSTEVLAGQDGLTECSLTFNLSKSTPTLEVFEGKIAGALVAKFNESWEATQVNENVGYMPFITAEKVSVKLPNGTRQPTPRVRIDCEKVPNSGGIANSCTLVAVPDQTN